MGSSGNDVDLLLFVIPTLAGEEEKHLVQEPFSQPSPTTALRFELSFFETQSWKWGLGRACWVF